jgi:hypothetical protein
MTDPTYSPERALKRLQQLAREEQAAVASKNTEALCRAAALLPAATQALVSARFHEDPTLAEVIAEIQAAHKAALSYLDAEMNRTAKALRCFASVRRAILSYARHTLPAPQRIDNCG